MFVRWMLMWRWMEVTSRMGSRKRRRLTWLLIRRQLETRSPVPFGKARHRFWRQPGRPFSDHLPPWRTGLPSSFPVFCWRNPQVVPNQILIRKPLGTVPWRRIAHGTARLKNSIEYGEGQRGCHVIERLPGSHEMEHQQHSNDGSQFDSRPSDFGDNPRLFWCFLLLISFFHTHESILSRRLSGRSKTSWENRDKTRVDHTANRIIQGWGEQISEEGQHGDEAGCRQQASQEHAEEALRFPKYLHQHRPSQLAACFDEEAHLGRGTKGDEETGHQPLSDAGVLNLGLVIIPY